MAQTEGHGGSKKMITRLIGDDYTRPIGDGSCKSLKLAKDNFFSLSCLSLFQVLSTAPDDIETCSQGMSSLLGDQLFI
jgi:hypothetical protein